MEKPDIIYIVQTNPGQLGVVNANYPGAVRYVRQEELSERKYDLICEVLRNRREILLRAIENKEYADEDTRVFWDAKTIGYYLLLYIPREALTTVTKSLYNRYLELLEEKDGLLPAEEDGLFSAYNDALYLLSESEKSIKIEL